MNNWAWNLILRFILTHLRIFIFLYFFPRWRDLNYYSYQQTGLNKGCNQLFSLILISISIFLAKHLGSKMSENSVKCPSHFPRIYVGKWRFSVYSDIKERKAANPHTGEAGISLCPWKVTYVIFLQNRSAVKITTQEVIQLYSFTVWNLQTKKGFRKGTCVCLMCERENCWLSVVKK